MDILMVFDLHINLRSSLLCKNAYFGMLYAKGLLILKRAGNDPE